MARPLNALLKEMVEQGASDLHITSNSPPMIRIHGVLEPLDDPALSPSETKHLSYSILTDKQKQRLEARLADPDKAWKFNMSDLETRSRWDEYMEAYTDAIEKCSTDYAPWYVIPADRKWYRNWAISSIVRRELESMDPKPPAKPGELEGVTID